jgi:N-acetylated-alpha-linked acidic dipeptidase
MTDYTRFMTYRIALLMAAALPLAGQTSIRGFAPGQVAAQRQLEKKALAVPEARNIGEYLKRMAAKPHIAGSPASREVAEYAAGLFRSWGYEVAVESFQVLLPYPTQRVVELVSPTKFKTSLVEPAIPEDPTSGQKDQIPSYNAYSASGDVTAPLVYVNYGVPDDYKVLAEQGIDVKGKIVIARYGQSWRGVKPKVAYEHGAVGCLIYSDPRDDGYFNGDPYPKGPWRPAASAQRGSVMDMSLYVGDPLTPGQPSDGDTKRLALADVTTLMKIPVLPISWEDAKPLLKSLTGPVAPPEWRGALPFTYHMGPGAGEVHLKLDFDWTQKPIYDVVATMPGSTWPDQWIVYGNHHDAWVNGANDPISGASSLLESARSLAMLRKQGWQPKRTIKFALWDAEEFGLVGSTEWVEKHQEELDRKTVAYVNSDANAKGTLGVSGSPSLEEFFEEILRDLPDPGDPKRSLLAAQKGKDAKEFHLGTLGSWSDFVAFIHHTGISSLSLGFGFPASGGVYHSIYDDATWYTKFADPDFEGGKSLSGVTMTSVIRLSEAVVLPFEFTRLATTIGGYLKELETLAADQKGSLNLKAPLAELEKLQVAAAQYETRYQAVNGRLASLSPAALEPLNRALYQTERALLLPSGLPGRPWYKSQICAPGQYTGYGAKTLPGIREPAELGQWKAANEQVGAVVQVLQTLTSRVNEASVLLAKL